MELSNARVCLKSLLHIYVFVVKTLALSPPTQPLLFPLRVTVCSGGWTVFCSQQWEFRELCVTFLSRETSWTAFGSVCAKKHSSSFIFCGWKSIDIPLPTIYKVISFFLFCYSFAQPPNQQGFFHAEMLTIYAGFISWIPAAFCIIAGQTSTWE